MTSQTPLPPQMLSPLDNRYHGVVAPLGEHLSEAALNRARVRVEVEWLLFLSDLGMFGAQPVPAEQRERLRDAYRDFGQPDIDALAAIEATTKHDVKAVEYHVREHLHQLGLGELAELTHFACTSEDINNLAYALTVRDATQGSWLPAARDLIEHIAQLARETRDDAMLSLTHGQPATPTTLGKELAVFAHRLRRAADRVEAVRYPGKFSGATGNFAAHLAADPEADWERIAQDFLAGLDLEWNPLTTQIESHDWQVELFQAIAHFNRILHNLCTDAWSYISRGIFRQKAEQGATGSSTMPHKINPIRFENAEANLELSCAVLDSLAATLVTTRLQRDLTDSSTQRNIGLAFGHSFLAIDNARRGLGSLGVDRELLARELDGNWEVLGEAIQTVIRAERVAGRSGIEDPYSVLKELTRGKRLGPQELRDFITGLDVGDEAKQRLLALTPASYTGRSSQLVNHLAD